MRSTWVRFLCLASLMFSLQFLNLGCSSSSSGEEGSEEVAASNEEEQAAAENNATENEEMANNAGANGAETNGAEGNGLNNAEGQGNALGAENNGMNEGMANNQAQQGGEEDLQQIIEEMNTANGQLPANNGGQGMMENGGNAMANDAGMGNAAMDPGMNAGANQASAAPEAAAPAAAPVSGAPIAPGLPELGSKMSYIVQKGDTLGKIAARIYGDANKWTEIANFTGLANPRLIYPGDVVYYQLTEQSMQFASTYESVKRSEVQIQQGDTLATIAGRVFGNSSLWKLIWRHNDGIDNPDRLTAGTTLYYVDPASMASMDSKVEQKFVKGQTGTNGKVVSVTKVKASKTVLEVANDSLDDLFSQTVSKDFLKRT